MSKTAIRSFIFAAIVIFGNFSLRAQSGDIPNSVYDAAKDETIVFHSPLLHMDPNSMHFPLDLNNSCKLFPIYLYENVAVVIYHKVKGKSINNNAETVQLGIKVGGPDHYLFEKKRTLTIETDLFKLQPGSMTVTERKSFATTTCSIRYLETLEMPIPLSDYRRIVDSKKVKIKVEDLEFSLSKDQVKLLKKIADEHFKS